MPPIAVLVALADPTRCRIIEILRDGAQPVHVLASHFDISRPAISRHLRVLKQAKLISEKKLGRENRYALHATKLKPVREWVEGILPSQAAAAVEPQPIVVKAESTVKAKPAPRKPVVEPVPAKPPGTTPISQMGFDF